MRRKTRYNVATTALACCVSALLLPACAPTHAVDADAIAGPLKAVAARHDAYVVADPSLSDPEKTTALRSSKILIEIVDEAQSTGN